MSKKSFIDSVEVREPCTEDWETMTGTDKIRFCSHCAKDVNNISEMTRKEATRVVRAAGSSVCIRYIPGPSGRGPMFAEQLYKITRRGTGLTAGVMTASLSLATLAYAQNEKPAENAPQAVVMSSDTSLRTNAEQEAAILAMTTGVIEGVIRDLTGKPVAGVGVELYSSEYSRNDFVSTDEDGRFRFAKIEPGQYGLKIESNKGVRKAEHGLDVIAGQTIFRNINVSTIPVPIGDGTGGGSGSGSGSGFGGAMAAIQYSSPLTSAIADNDVDKVKDLIASGAKINAKDKNYDNITPLFVAVENGNVEIVRMLLNAGAKVNAVNKTKRTPLMYIDDDATPELIDMLVRAGADINATDEDGDTALMNAISYSPPETIRALIAAGADIEQTNNDGETALIKAADGDDADAVKILVMAGASVNARNKSGESAWDKTSDPAIEAFLENYGAAVARDLIEVSVPAVPDPK